MGTGLIKTYRQRDTVMKRVEQHLDNHSLVDSAIIEASGGMGSFETFYGDVYMVNDTHFSFRFSGHNAADTMPDEFLWNDQFETVADLLSTLDELVEKQYIEQEKYL